MSPGFWAGVGELGLSIVKKFVARPSSDERQAVMAHFAERLAEKVGDGELADIAGEFKSNALRRIRADTAVKELTVLEKKADVALKLLQVERSAAEIAEIANRLAAGVTQTPSISSAEERAQRALSVIVQRGGGLHLNGENLQGLIGAAENPVSSSDAALRPDEPIPIQTTAEGTLSPSVIVEGAGLSTPTASARATGDPPDDSPAADGGSNVPPPEPTASAETPELHPVSASYSGGFESLAGASSGRSTTPVVPPNVANAIGRHPKPSAPTALDEPGAVAGLEVVADQPSVSALEDDSRFVTEELLRRRDSGTLRRPPPFGGEDQLPTAEGDQPGAPKA